MKDDRLDAGCALYTAGQIREIELSFADKFQQGTYPLMEAAGHSAYQQLKHFWPEARRILILTGKGNNGGDGFVMARLATQERKKVTLCRFVDSEKLSGDALKAYMTLPRGGIELKDWQQIKLEEYDLVVDAMLGTGIKGAVREPFIEVIRAVNLVQTPVLAIDVPSGLDTNTGTFINCAIKADVTVTFVGHKRGLYSGDSANYRGKLRLLDLDIPADCFGQHEFAVVSEDWFSLRHKLVPRLPVSHKGDFGHCLVIGGAKGMLGAGVMAASAAARTGSGLTSAWLQQGAENLVSIRPEVMAKNISLDNIEQQVQLLPSVNCLVLGPGLGKESWAIQWMEKLRHCDRLMNKAKVWDADALNWLAENPDYDECRILTPHPGEAGRLLGISASEVNQDRFAASAAIARQYGGVCVLKGAGTVISDTHGMQIVCAVGNPGMASGGMGDILSGIIGGLLAQGFSLLDAAALGVCIHGEAGDMAAGKHHHYRGILATDLLKYLPVLLNP